MITTYDGLGALTLFVPDPAVAGAFYGEVLGLELLFTDDVSAVYALGDTVINLLAVETAATDDLVGPLEVRSTEGPPQMLLSLWVTDVDATCAELVTRGGVLLNGPVDRSWGKRTAAFVDPAGVAWELAQDIPVAE